MDLTDTIVPKSDQLNAEDMLTGPRTFTIKEVTGGSSEQPVNVHLVELPGRPYRPSKSMRRVFVSAWGKDTSPYAGRRLTLYRDPKVRFGSDEVGGIKISHLSHIEKRMSLALTVTRGKRSPHVVDPLPEPTNEERVTALRAEWKCANAARRKVIEADVATLSAPTNSGAEEAPGGETAATVPVEPTEPSAPESPLCPECTAGKHVNCSGQAWDAAADEPTSCTCPDDSHAAKS